MPAANNTATFRFEGNRGLVSNQRKHAADPTVFSVYDDVYNDAAGRRRKRPGLGAPKGGATIAMTQGTQIHEFTRRDPGASTITRYIFRTCANVIQRWNQGTTAWVTMALPILPTGTTWEFIDFANVCWAVTGSDPILYFDGTTGPDGREWYTLGIADPQIAPGYSLVAADPPYSTGTVSVTNGGLIVTGSGATNWAMAGNGKRIEIAGVAYDISTIDVASPGQITLRKPYLGDTAAGVAYVIRYGLMSWDEPPTYAYAYKNTTTGHISDLSPFLQITEKDQTYVTPRITGIPRSPADFNNGYNKIQIFRTPKNAAILVAIDDAAALLNNSAVVGTTTFTETSATFEDVDLGILEGPIVSNTKPVDSAGTALNFLAIAAWQDRLWALAQDGRLYYSATKAEILFGRAPECWPAVNQLTVTDGRGLLTIGSGDDNDTLVIVTGSGDYGVVGRDSVTYRLRKLPTREQAGFVDGALAVRSRMVQLYTDKRLYDYGMTQGDGDLGRPIQNLLDGIKDSLLTTSRLVRYSYGPYDFLLLATTAGSGSTSNDIVYVYNYDSESWSRWHLSLTAMGVVHNPTTGVLELWVASGALGSSFVYPLLPAASFTDNGNLYAPAIRTAMLRPGGESVRSEFKWLRAIVNDVSSTWNTTIFIDEGSGLTRALTPTPSPGYQSAQGRDLGYPFASNEIRRGRGFEVQVTFPAVAFDLWIEALEAVIVQDQVAEATL